MKIGYCRVSTQDQNLDAQREQLLAAGCQPIYEEKASGKSADDRPELQSVRSFLRAGDVLVVPKLDRRARNTIDMLTIVTDLGQRGVKFTSLAEPWCDTTNPAGELMLTVFAGVAQFERARMKERQIAGIQLAKQRGVYKGGKTRFDPELIRQRLAAGKRPYEIRDELGCSFDTINRAARASAATS